MYIPYLKFSDPLPKTHIFFIWFYIITKPFSSLAGMLTNWLFYLLAIK